MLTRELFSLIHKNANSARKMSEDVSKLYFTCRVSNNPVVTERRYLNRSIMNDILQPDNLLKAYKKVKSNKGAPGIDKISVMQLENVISQEGEIIIAQLLEGKYKPKPLREIRIPKDNGDFRTLKIPTVVDRWILQAINQVLYPILDEDFSKHSYGFRKNVGPQDAVKQAQTYVSQGYKYVVDIDIEKFFDSVNHDKLMAKIDRYVGDSRVLKLIREYLRVGIMENGVVKNDEEGIPQGSPLSPLLANLYLNDLDMELTKRGYKFCRYADDCNIHVRNIKTAERVLGNVTQFIERKLKLKVNKDKSKATSVRNSQFLGYTIQPNARLGASKKSIKKLKKKINLMTRPTQGISLETLLKKIQSFIKGWTGFFKLDRRSCIFIKIDKWLRRRIRAYILRQLKKPKTVLKWLKSRGVKLERHIGLTAKGTWRRAKYFPCQLAMNNAWLKNIGLLTFSEALSRFGS